MIQLNLLPDVKIAYIKARAQKRLVILGSVIIASASLAIFILLFAYVHAVQSKSINDLTKTIKNSSSELSSTKDLDKILTVQNQLSSLSSLHDQKPALDRLPRYIAITTPDGTKLTSFDLDFATNSLTISGNAIGLDGINTYVNTLKAAQYVVKDGGKTPLPAFSDIVLTSFSRGEGAAAFSVSLKFDPELFVSKKEITLSIKGSQGSVLNNDAFGTGVTTEEGN